LLAFPLFAVGQVTVPIVSGTTWSAADAKDNPLAAGPNAENVCPGTNPVNCAPGATSYGGSFDPWIVPAQFGYPAATWIWAPGVTGATTPASPQTFWFSTTFYLCGTPPYQDGTLSVASDNVANVYLNSQPQFFTYSSASTSGGTTTFTGSGMTVLPVGASITVAGDSNLSYDETYSVVTSSTSVLTATSSSGTPSGSGANGAIYGGGPPPIATSAGFSAATTVAVPGSQLAQGENIINIVATNTATPGCEGQNSYQCNPAGVLFGASFTDSVSAEPTCSGGASVGTVQTKSCPSGQTGDEFRVCACILGNGEWTPWFNACQTPPPTYTIGGTISGLTGGGLELQDNGGNNLTVSAGASSFTFNGSVPAGSSYSVTVLTQPSNPTQSCTVANGSGTANGNVTNIEITCKTTTPPPTCTGANGQIYGVGQTQSIACSNGEVGSQTETCQSNGAWSAPSGTCSCPSGQLLCLNTLTQTNQCVVPQPGLKDNSGVVHSWCGNILNENISCSSACQAGVACGPAYNNSDHLQTTDLYCGDGSIGTATGGGSDVALVTFLALMAVWSTAIVWRLRKKASP